MTEHISHFSQNSSNPATRQVILLKLVITALIAAHLLIGFPTIAEESVGLLLQDDDPYARVAGVIMGSSAAKSDKVRRNDWIIAIASNGGNGSEFLSTRGKTAAEVRRMLSGQPGSVIGVKILPAGKTDIQDAHTIRLRRDVEFRDEDQDGRVLTHSFTDASWTNATNNVLLKVAELRNWHEITNGSPVSVVRTVFGEPILMRENEPTYGWSTWLYGAILWPTNSFAISCSLYIVVSNNSVREATEVKPAGTNALNGHVFGRSGSHRRQQGAGQPEQLRPEP